MKLKLLFVMVLVSPCVYSQGLMGKALAKLAKAMAPPPATVSNLDQVVPMAGLSGNLHPVELGTISQSFFNGWTTGGDMAWLMFTRKDTSAFVKIDGTVTVNGVPVEYSTAGTYALISGANAAARKVEITTSTGQKAGFTMEPAKSKVKVLSVNGQKDNISLDLTKDVVIELENTDVPANAMLRVDLAINQVGIKSQYGVCYIRSGASITIPAAAFRNINIKPAGGAVYNYKKSFISVTVETTEPAVGVSGAFPGLTYIRSYSDGKFVTISKEPNLNTGLVAKGKEDLKDGTMSYEFSKPNAFSSRPLPMMKKIGISSISVMGKTVSVSSVITQEKDNLKGEAQTTKTTTVTFPQQTNETWEAVIAKLYPQLAAIVQKELNATIVPVEAIQKTAAYQSVSKYAQAEVNTAKEFLIDYDHASPLRTMPVGQGAGAYGINEKMMNEAGVDALMKISLSLEVQQDGDYGVLVPKLTFEITGKANGRETATVYYSGTLTGKGVPSENIGLRVEYASANGITGDTKGRNSDKTYHHAGTIGSDELDRIVRRSDLLALFAKGLKEIKDQEKANGDYEVVWQLQQ
ncbi:MAG: hypothetical protein V4658_15240 [Bacteroidota bacterium]